MFCQRATCNNNNSSAHTNSSKMNMATRIKMNLTQTMYPWRSMAVEEVSGDRPRTRKHVRLTEDEGDDLEARIKRTVKHLVPDVIQAVLSSQNQPAAVSNENSEVRATSWSGTIWAAGPAQT